MAALSAMAGRAGGAMGAAGGAMGAAGGAVGARMGAASTAMQGTAAYQGAAETAGKPQLSQLTTVKSGSSPCLVSFISSLHHWVLTCSINVQNKRVIPPKRTLRTSCPTLSLSLLQFHAHFYWLRMLVPNSVVLLFSSSVSWVL